MVLKHSTERKAQDHTCHSVRHGSGNPERKGVVCAAVSALEINRFHWEVISELSKNWAVQVLLGSGVQRGQRSQGLPCWDPGKESEQPGR